MPTLRRRIIPKTRDYALTLGEYEQDLGVTSKVLARVATKRGSVVPLPTFGSRLHTIKGAFPGATQLAERYTRECLQDLVRAREVNELSVTAPVDREAGAALLCIVIEFRDRRGRPQKVPYTHRIIGS